MPMTRDRAKRFAEILYKEFCHEGHFDVVLPPADLPIVADVFQLDLNCKTKLDENNRRLTVYCPVSG
jgi:hypothetical protein